MIILFLIETFAAFKSVSSPENTLRWIELYQIILGIFLNLLILYWSLAN